MIRTIKRLLPTPFKRYVRWKAQCWSLRGEAVQCPICGFRGRHFADDVWHVRTICPSCYADTRHRILVSALKQLPECEGILAGKRVLHFAPEPVLGEFLAAEAKEYVTADLCRSDVDLKVDMTNMPSVPSESFDCCIACDVLEHVADDHAALAELFRVLRPNGVAVVAVPQSDDALKTYEDPSITTPEGRTQAFGQFDHVRFYGSDVVDRIQAVGFRVTVIDEQSFPKEMVDRFVLRPPVLSKNPLATNFRKLYVCRKP
jgi:SAM-dependent methyltransferase